MLKPPPAAKTAAPAIPPGVGWTRGRGAMPHARAGKLCHAAGRVLEGSIISSKVVLITARPPASATYAHALPGMQEEATNGPVADGACFLLLAVVGAAVQGIFMAALYRYASEHQVAPGFRLENFSMAWQRK